MTCCIEQFVDEILDFSSQYGSVGSISYVASNLSGSPSFYPSYGDSNATFSLRTYGRWWETNDSSIPFIIGIPSPYSSAVDFVDLSFKIAVQPIQVDIYETYNPGSVIRIWAFSSTNKWILLWDGEPVKHQPLSCIFSPTINKCEAYINKLRVEFDQRGQDYYSAFDAVKLVGATAYGHLWKINSYIVENNLFSSLTECDIINGVKFIVSDHYKTFVQTFSRKDKFKKIRSDISSHSHEIKEFLSPSSFNVDTEGGYFSLLPGELLLHILKFLDLKTLCSFSLTCKLINKSIKDPLLYQKLNLKNYWWLVNRNCLSWLSVRCHQLRALDFSWCGSYGGLSSEDFMEFIHLCGCNLTSLYLNNCHFVDNYCLYFVANTCLDLQALSLSACQNVDHMGFGELKKLGNLTLLNLTRTKIEFRVLSLILQNTPQLKHLHIDNCSLLDIDEVALTSAIFNCKLVSFSAWKAKKGLTTRGMRALACIHTLKDLDLGWAISHSTTEALRDLVQWCPNLRKLFLTALRTLTDQDIAVLASYGHHLQQVDFTGNRNITPDAIHKLLKSCRELKLLDVSYCDQISNTFIEQLALEFANVTIRGGT